MKELYPLIPAEVNNVHQSQWLSVQKFAQDHPKFDHYFNWEFDTRFTGHHYNLLEKLATFAKKQPRKGLWERNERYYIPSFHDRFSTFRLAVQKVAGDESIWVPPPTPGVDPVGPKAPSLEPKDDSFHWGVGEEADYISLAPMFSKSVLLKHSLQLANCTISLCIESTRSREPESQISRTFVY